MGDAKYPDFVESCGMGDVRGIGGANPPAATVFSRFLTE